MLVSLLRQAVLCLTLSGLLAVTAHAQTTGSLSAAIIDANWNNANWIYSNSSVESNVAVLTPLAQNNVVMAQWFLADALARQGKDSEAAVWLYSASLATRMDGALCRQKQTETIEYRFLQMFAPQFARLRANETYRRNALTSAIRYHGTRLQASNQPDWVCRLVAHETARPGRALRNSMARNQVWMDTRKRVFEEYKKQTGLDFSRSPDLIKINPVSQGR